jgi:hypothetical protein
MGGIGLIPEHLCPACGRLMDLTRTIAASPGYRELRTYGCRDCGVWVTEGSPPGERPGRIAGYRLWRPPLPALLTRCCPVFASFHPINKLSGLCGVSEVARHAEGLGHDGVGDDSDRGAASARLVIVGTAIFQQRGRSFTSHAVTDA